MASVTSLDNDLRRLRLEKYTPAAANEAKQWIESVLGTRLPGNDLLDGLKDGVALCKLVNLAIGPPGVKFKQSNMPFVQMENISQFLRACQLPPLSLQQHDMFLTVDLYERKDPAQVLQCIGAFSRAANAINPTAFPTVIGPKSSRAGLVSPQSTGSVAAPIGSTAGSRTRDVSGSSSASSLYAKSSLAPSKTGDSGSGRPRSPGKFGTSPPPPVSTWSKREDEVVTAPAWNIAQYGYMGGASQGNLGISFGGRRQITSPGPYVPTLAEKEKKRKEKEAEEARKRKEEEERRKREIEEEERRAREEEERRWEEETLRLREEERKKLEEEKKRWEEEERQWKLEEERRRKEEEEAEARLRAEREKARKQRSSGQLRGQYLSKYQEEEELENKRRIRELERQLEEARRREAEYERARQERFGRAGLKADERKARSRSRSRPPPQSPGVARQDSWSVRDEAKFVSTPVLLRERQQEELAKAAIQSPRPLPDPAALPTAAKLKPHKTGGVEALTPPAPALPLRKQHTGSRPLPDPTIYPPTSPRQQPHARATSPLPSPNQAKLARPSPFAPRSPPQPGDQEVPKTTYARELGFSADDESQRRSGTLTSSPTKKGSWASKSLLEREMELERQRQREWEEAQRETTQLKANNPSGGVDGIGGGIGGRWDVSQWTGYTGGDNQNRGTQGIGASRRPIVGPRPLPDPPK